MCSLRIYTLLGHDTCKNRYLTLVHYYCNLSVMKWQDFYFNFKKKLLRTIIKFCPQSKPFHLEKENKH